jgi:hypothetical protein
MGEESSQIAREIENTRAELGSNLAELERKVKGFTDWRQRFEKSPLTMMGVAFGGGLLLATTVGGGRRGSRRSCEEKTRYQPVPTTIGRRAN